MRHLARSAIIERSAEELYGMVEDIESYPSFLPWCAGASVHERAPGRSLASITLGVKGLRQSITTENAIEPGRSIEMKMVKGPFKHFAAAWRFTPLGPRAAKIEFSIDYEFANRVIARALEPLFTRIADDTVEAFAQRASSDAKG